MSISSVARTQRCLLLLPGFAVLSAPKSVSQQFLKCNLNFQVRTIIHTNYAPINARPPPREYESDGTLKRYQTNAFFFDHGIAWTKWHWETVGSFHICYEGETAAEFGPRAAYREQFRYVAQWIPLLTVGMITAATIQSISAFGIRPSMYTEDWLHASIERDRAENSYPFTRYMDRRRKERGPNWPLKSFGMWHTNNGWMNKHRDTAYLRAKALKARNDFLLEEQRKERLEAKDAALEKSLESEQ